MRMLRKGMMSRPRRHQRGRRIAPTLTRPAPIDGWRSDLPNSGMDPRSAVDLINWIPKQDGCETRGGITSHCDTSTSAAVRRLIEYDYGTTQKLLAASDGGIYDVTSASPSTLGSSLTSDYWVDSSLNGTMFLANGEDTMKKFDGTTLADSTFTGVTLSNLNYVHVHKSRVYVIEKNTQSFWYGSSGAISGALTEFDLSLVGNFSGNLKILLSISQNAGDNPQDYFAAIFEGGDVIVYSGSDPGDATDWGKIGQFKIGRPISRFSAINFGDDIIVITDRGYESLKVGFAQGDIYARSRLIGSSIQADVLKSISTNFTDDNWHCAVYPNGQLLIIQPPVSGVTSEQHVMNLNTRRWCRFRDMSATAWGRLGSVMYVGDSSGVVHKFDQDASDNGTAIECVARTAWDGMADRNVTKIHNMQRLSFTTAYMPDVRFSLATDYGEWPAGTTVSFDSSEDIPVWDEVYWDDDVYWGADKSSYEQWIAFGVEGYMTSAQIVVRTTLEKVLWNSITYLYENGGAL